MNIYEHSSKFYQVTFWSIWATLHSYLLCIGVPVSERHPWSATFHFSILTYFSNRKFHCNCHMHILINETDSFHDFIGHFFSASER